MSRLQREIEAERKNLAATAQTDAILIQRAELKRGDPDAILLFRVTIAEEDGNPCDAYQTTGDDAVILDEILGGSIRVAFSVSPGGRDARLDILPRDLESVLARIVAAGKRAAVCERVESTEAKYPGRNARGRKGADHG